MTDVAPIGRRAALGSIPGLVLLGGCLFGSDEQPDERTVNARGEIEIVIDGSPVDLAADRYQAEHAENHSIEFHLHEGDEYWYMEGVRRVTFAEAIDLLPHFSFEHGADGDVLEHDGETYESSAGAELRFVVGDEEVDPTYTLQDGDEVRLEVSSP